MNWRCLRIELTGAVALIGAIVFLVGVVYFVAIPVWSECLSKNSFLFCAAALGGK